MRFHMNIQVISTFKRFVANAAVDIDEKMPPFDVFVQVRSFVAEIIAVSARPPAL